MGRSLAPVYLVCLVVMAVALWPRPASSPEVGVVRAGEAEPPAAEYRLQVVVAADAPAGLWLEVLDGGGGTLLIHDPDAPAAGGRERVALAAGTSAVLAVRERPASLRVRLGDSPDAPVHHEAALDATAGVLTGVRVP